jgi:3-methyladenine DNA glycosylase AlkD
MNLSQVMTALKRAGTEENRIVYRRHGARGEVFGVGLSSLDLIAERVGSDPQLAKKLWATRNADARILATKIADPRSISAAELATWAKDLDWYVGADALAKLAFHSVHTKKLTVAWIESKNEWVARAGWHTLALLTRDKTLPDTFFEPYLARIEKGIHRAPNRTRDAMNAALIAIGIRSDAFAKGALAAAKRIGRIDVDYGDASLRTPNAATYIRRARAWIEQMTTRKARKPAAAKSAKAAPKKRGKAALKRKPSRPEKAKPSRKR